MSHQVLPNTTKYYKRHQTEYHSKRGDQYDEEHAKICNKDIIVNTTLEYGLALSMRGPTSDVRIRRL